MTAQKIHSRANPSYKALKAIRNGWEADSIIVEGIKLIDEALAAGLLPRGVWITDTSLDPGLDCPTYQIPASLYQAVSPTKSGNAPLAVFPGPKIPAARPEALESGRYLLLDGVQEPGNAGGLVRAGLAYSIDGIIWRTPCVFPFHHACLRASAGCIFKVQNFLCDADFFAGCKLPFIGTATDGNRDIRTYSPPLDFILIMGNEGHGISTEAMRATKINIRIPIDDRVESLNVSGACHIILFSLMDRQVPS